MGQRGSVSLTEAGVGMSANQPTSFRFPFALPEGEVHPTVIAAIKYAFGGILDAQNAIRSLNTKLNASTAAATTINETIATAGGGSSSPVFGTVNLQPNLTPGAYTLAQSDFGGLILINSSVAFALSLNSSLMLPFFATVYNFGSGLVTATPTTGNVNSVGSVSLDTGEWGIFFFDGTNWWALLTTTTVGLQIFANNAAAIGGGLVAGDLYRTGGDPSTVCVVF